jgi:ubiquinone/menaquinone biosynthesis C-methylase UbiE
MDAKLQRRIQRYGWDLAASDYEALWRAQLAEVQAALLAAARPAAGEIVLDAACGVGSVAVEVAHAVGPDGRVLGVDLSGKMVDAARRRAEERGLSNVEFMRMDAEELALPSASFDLALCALGLPYMPDPERAVSELRRILRPGGRIALSVWGERARCGWSALFPIVDAEVATDVCPRFFRLGRQDELVQACARARFEAIEQRRIATTLSYADADAACDAALVGGPVALAWSRFDDAARSRVRASYLEAIEPWRVNRGYLIPAEFVVVSAAARREGAGSCFRA